jgi:hypothetical protein
MPNPNVSALNMPRRAFLSKGMVAAAVAALVRSQIPAVAATALFRNQEALASAPPAAAAYPIVELRQYTVLPDRRDPFAVLFEREFIEPQEEIGMKVIGHFRDLDNPNRFVWLRGFSDMPSRAKQLQEFYGGPIWKAHRDEANANFTDTDNVLLLHTAHSTSGFDLSHMRRAPMGATENPNGLLVATIYYFDGAIDDGFVRFFDEKIVPALRKNGINPIARFKSETEPNNFPRLPVREKDHVFIWFAMYDNVADYEKHLAALNASPNWRDWLSADLRHRLNADAQTLRLAPMPRSLLHR